MEFTKKQFEQWRLFEDYRQTGKFNMFSAFMGVMLGMTKSEHLFIIKNYKELKQAYEAEEDEHYDNMYKQMLGDDRYHAQG
jgi:hypothetical protein